MIKRRNSICVAFIGIMLLISCKKSESEQSLGCCQNPIIDTLYAINVCYLGEGHFRIIDKPGTTNLLDILYDCSLPNNLNKAASDTIPNYIISGYNKGYCGGQGVWAGPRIFEVTSIKPL